MIKPISLLLLIFLTGNIHAQTDSVSYHLLQSAYRCQEEGNRDSAIVYFSGAGEYLKKNKNWPAYLECIAGENRNYLQTDRIGDVEAKSLEALQIIAESRVNELDVFVIEIYNQLARSYWYAKGNFPEALRLLEKSLALCNKADFEVSKHRVQVYTDFGYTFGYAGDFDNSEIYFTKALELSKEFYGENDPVIADRFTDLVFPMIQKSEWEKAEIALKKAIALNIKNRGADHITVLKNYNNLGYIYLEKFDNDQAILYISMALKMIREKYGENHRSIGVGYMNLGASYSNKGDYVSSIFYSKKALENFEISVGNRNPYMGIVLTNLANEYNHENIIDSAEIYYDKALRLKLDLYGKNHLEIVKTYGYMSNFYLKNKRYELAIAAINNAVEIGKKVLPAKHKISAENHLYLAEYYAETGELEKSLDAAQQALIAIVPSFNDMEISSNPNLEEVSSMRTIVDILIQKTQTLYQLSRQNKDYSLLLLAAQTAVDADRSIDLLRSGYQTPDSKEILLTRSGNFYELGIAIEFELQEYSDSSKNYSQAFTYFEKSKSILLIENVKNTDDPAYSILPDSLRIQEKSLSRSIDVYKEKLFEAKYSGDTAQLNLIQSAYFQKKRDYDFLLNFLKENFPKFYSLRHNVSQFSIGDLQKNTDAGVGIFNYFYGEKNIYLLAVTNQAVFPLIISNGPELEGKLNRFIYSLEQKQFDRQLSFEIYTKILEPVLAKEKLSHITHLTFVPDGSLHYIPFEALITSIGNDRIGNYLINDYTINYLHTASLPELFQNEEVNVNYAYLGFSPGYQKESESLLASRYADNQLVETLQKLPMAEKEIMSSAKLWKGDFFIGENATEENFKNLSEQAGIIHIASHTIIDDNDPMNSLLVFSPGMDTLEDGLLHTYELYNMKLNAQLACLSACKTGFGKIKGGEGVVSLAKGFFYAGVPNVMMSLWSVPDQSTSEIMIYFYEELEKGVGKADALRNAKLRYLQTSDANTTDPYYWAAFTLIGDNKPLEKAKAFPYWVVGLFVVTAALSGIVLYTFRKSEHQLVEPPVP